MGIRENDMSRSTVRVLTLAITIIFAIAMISLFNGYIEISFLGWLILVIGWLYIHYKYPNEQTENT